MELLEYMIKINSENKCPKKVMNFFKQTTAE